MYDDPNRESLGLPPIWTGAGDVVEPLEPDTDPSAFSIPHIRDWTDDHPDRADEVLAAERARGDSARATLLDWLEGFIAHRDED